MEAPFVPLGAPGQPAGRRPLTIAKKAGSRYTVGMTSSLAPGFLIASPPLGDPNFDRTVVLLAVHSEAGALGFIVNRTTSLSIGELLSYAGYGETPLDDSTPVFLGGPVQPSSGWIVAIDPDLDDKTGGVIEVGERVRISSSRTAFDSLARDVRQRAPGASDPKRRLVVVGYSGWGPGQLESEIGAGAWLPVPLDEGVLFDVDADQRWERAYALSGLSPLVMMSMRTVGQA